MLFILFFVNPIRLSFYYVYNFKTVQGVHKVLHTFKILISQKPHKVETLNFRR